MIIDAAVTVDAAATTGAGCMDRRGNLGVEADDGGGRTSAPRRRARYVLAIYEGWMTPLMDRLGGDGFETKEG